MPIGALLEFKVSSLFPVLYIRTNATIDCYLGRTHHHRAGIYSGQPEGDSAAGEGRDIPQGDK